MLKKKVLLVAIAVILSGVGAVGIFISRASAAGDTYYVNGDTGDDGYDGTSLTFVSGSVGPKRTISGAIATASSGDTIILAPKVTLLGIGTININKGVTIESYAGTWQSTNNSKISGNSILSISASNVTLDGIVFENTTSANAITASAPTSGVTIRDCRFEDTDYIGINAVDGTSWGILDNFFANINDGVPPEAISTDSMVSSVISDNTFTNIEVDAIDDSGSTNLSITNNDFYHVGFYGIELSSTNGAIISGNSLQHTSYTAAGAGIFLLADTLTAGTIEITDNDINNTYGVETGTAIGTSLSDLGGATVNITDNNLAGNVWGIEYAGIGTISAQNNWWGSSTGPYHQTLNPHGTGSAITDNAGIDFTPYDLTDSWVKSSPVYGNTSMVVFKDKLFQSRRDKNAHSYIRYSANGRTWSSWVYFGHTYADSPLVSYDGRLYQAIRAANNYLYIRSTSDGISWTGWTNISKMTVGKINMLSYDGRLYLTMRGTNGYGYMRIYSGSWSSWVSLGTSLSEIETVTFGPGIVQTRIASNQYLYWRTSLDGVSWTSWSNDGGASGKALSVSTIEFDGSLYQVKVGTNNLLYTRASGAPWGPWVSGGSALGKVATTVLDDRLYQARRTTSNGLYVRYTFDGSTWSAWQSDNNTLSDVTMTPFSGELFRAIRGTDGYLYTTRM